MQVAVMLVSDINIDRENETVCMGVFLHLYDMHSYSDSAAFITSSMEI